MAKIVTFGEIMLRLSTPNNQRLIQSNTFDVNYGGGEANVAVSLANYGHDVTFVSKVPDHEIGTAAINSLRRFGVHTEHIARGGDRLGIYYLETGAAMRPSKVIYDRANSAIATAQVSDFDFDKIFANADWFHFTGITPALGKNAQTILLAALKAAKKHHVTVSVDLNYRKKLWTPAEAQACMTQLMPYVDICIGNEEDAEKCLGFKVPNTDVNAGKLNLAGYQTMLRELQQKFGFKIVATTLRESRSADDNTFSAAADDGKNFYHSNKYDIHIVDRVGSGDSFVGGLIHGWLKYQQLAPALEFGTAASALKHTIPGDVNMVTEAEVLNLAQGDKSGRVQR